MEIWFLSLQITYFFCNKLVISIEIKLLVNVMSLLVVGVVRELINIYYNVVVVNNYNPGTCINYTMLNYLELITLLRRKSYQNT